MHRFEDLRVRTAVPRQVLSDRLAALVQAGLLRREPCREPGARERHEYRLTDEGLDLYPVLVGLMAWGDTYLADPQGPAAERRRPAGTDVRADAAYSRGAGC